MKNKILSIIAIAIMVLVPFKVSAEEVCTEYTNHYFFHLALTEWSSEQTAACPNGIDSCTASVITWTRTNTARFPLEEGAEIIDSPNVTSNPTIATINNTYHPALRYMIENKRNNYSISNTVTYYLQSSTGNLTDFEYPWFLSPEVIVDSDSTRSTVLQQTLNGGYLYSGLTGFTTNKPSVSYNQGDDYIDITLSNRIVSLSPSVLAKSTLDLEQYDGDSSTGKARAMILPQVVTVKYEICEEEELEEEIKFTTVYYPNNGTDDEPKKFTTTDLQKAKSASDLGFKYEGHKFLGWAHNSKATEVDIEVGTLIGNSDDLYAVWEPIEDEPEETKQYIVTYHKNDGSTTNPNSYTLDEGTVYSIIENPYTRDGYKFVGWSTNKDATKADTTYDPGKKYTVNKNLNLYAVWVKVEGATGTTDQSKNGLGYSIGILGTILAATGGGIVYFKKRNKFENI